jgi:hypothetical protein
MKLRRDNHFLPECYQKGFADGSGHVWIKETGKDPELRNPSSVGTGRNFYVRAIGDKQTDDVERWFETNVETQFALLSQRIKNERENLTNVSANELGTLARFVASQAVRTMAHKQCIEEQAGVNVDTNTFVQVMGRKILTVINRWLDDSPIFDFLTPLPFIGETFITGDHPVLALVFNDNRVWTPTDEPQQGITNLAEILNKRHAFSVALSPYICVYIYGRATRLPSLPPRTVEPIFVRKYNDLVRGQCRIFTLARDRSSLN